MRPCHHGIESSRQSRRCHARGCPGCEAQPESTSDARRIPASHPLHPLPCRTHTPPIPETPVRSPYLLPNCRFQSVEVFLLRGSPVLRQTFGSVPEPPHLPAVGLYALRGQPGSVGEESSDQVVHLAR